MDYLLKDLNNEQRKAVQTISGPLIIFAGAGSGKTRVLTRRIAYLIKRCGIDPNKILAITFTNKAANEMKERVVNLIGDSANDMWIMTFHSMCAKILRSHIHLLGFDNKFSIYDPDDQNDLIKTILKDLEITGLKSKDVLRSISSLKNQGITSDKYVPDTFMEELVKRCYETYEESMFMNNSLDFDDLLLKTKQLFIENKDIRKLYQDQFEYILIDEYQDTNHVQFELVELLLNDNENICVVGDDDQSIYKFRGADINNILNFNDDFSDARRIFLTQNYRSTKNILKLASMSISNNSERVEKELWTENEQGDKVKYIGYNSDLEEADEVIKKIRSLKRAGYNYSDIAILYRSNMQSRLFEEACLSNNVPYQIIGSIGFYNRKEIKDILAYLKILSNPSDNVALKRIINRPKRKIGESSVKKLEEYASENGLTLYQSLTDCCKVISSKKTCEEISSFIKFIEEIKKLTNLNHIVDRIINDSGYLSWLRDTCDSEEYKDRFSNIMEFINKVSSMMDENPKLTLSDFLESAALITEAKSDPSIDKITLMTLHMSKGLEFKNVFIVGLNKGLFPSSYFSKDTEEERRLFYVGITRAMENLTLTSARRRRINGKIVFSGHSEFLEELPRGVLEYKEASHFY